MFCLEFVALEAKIISINESKIEIIYDALHFYI